MPGEVTGSDRPFFLPFWVWVGDFDKGHVGEYFPSSGSQDYGVVTMALLFLYVFIMTVVLTNLLIAQMSSTYERYKDEKNEIWQAGRVQLICECIPAAARILVSPPTFAR